MYSEELAGTTDKGTFFFSQPRLTLNYNLPYSFKMNIPFRSFFLFFPFLSFCLSNSKIFFSFFLFYNLTNKSLPSEADRVAEIFTKAKSGDFRSNSTIRSLM